jgi:pyruvate/2-oxoglutarate dehydrogenase complex dihydrolipoamide acyltransferase (E2) component
VKTVTYRGPDGWFRIDEPETVTLPQGTAVTTTDEVAETLANYGEGHEFDVSDAEPARVTDKAAELAAEHDIDLETVKPTGKTGDITVDDVKAAIAAANDNPPAVGATQEG